MRRWFVSKRDAISNENNYWYKAYVFEKEYLEAISLQVNHCSYAKLKHCYIGLRFMEQRILEMYHTSPAIVSRLGNNSWIPTGLYHTTFHRQLEMLNAYSNMPTFQQNTNQQSIQQHQDQKNDANIQNYTSDCESLLDSFSFEKLYDFVEKVQYDKKRPVVKLACLQSEKHCQRWQAYERCWENDAKLLGTTRYTRGYGEHQTDATIAKHKALRDIMLRYQMFQDETHQMFVTTFFFFFTKQKHSTSRAGTQIG